MQNIVRKGFVWSAMLVLMMVSLRPKFLNHLEKSPFLTVLSLHEWLSEKTGTFPRHRLEMPVKKVRMSIASDSESLWVIHNHMQVQQAPVLFLRGQVYDIDFMGDFRQGFLSTVPVLLSGQMSACAPQIKRNNKQSCCY